MPIAGFKLMWKKSNMHSSSVYSVMTDKTQHNLQSRVDHEAIAISPYSIYASPCHRTIKVTFDS